MSDRRSELSVEHLDGVRNRVSKLNEAWDNRFQLGSPKFLERYKRGGFEIHLRIRVEFGEGDSGDFCAVFGGQDELGRSDSSDTNPWAARVDRNLIRRSDGAVCNDQQSMLVDIAQTVENEKSVVSRFLRPVWLYGFDDLRRGSGDALYYSIFTGLSVFLSGVADRKLGPPAGVAVFSEYERPNKMVETGPQVVDNFASENLQSGRYLQGVAIGFKDKFSRIVLTLYDATVMVGVELKEPFKFRTEILDVLVGPLNLRQPT